MCEPGQPSDDAPTDPDIIRKIVRAAVTACRDAGGSDAHMVTAITSMLHRNAKYSGRPFWKEMLTLTLAAYQVDALVFVRARLTELQSKRTARKAAAA